jgi:hypothetical protein
MQEVCRVERVTHAFHGFTVALAGSKALVARRLCHKYCS